MRARRPPRRRGVTALIVAAILIGAAAVGAGVGAGAPVLADRLGLGDPDPMAPPPAPVQAMPRLRALPANAPAPTPSGVRSVLSPLVGPALGTFGGQVIDPASGQLLWSSGSNAPLLPASTAKILTTAAALLSVDTEQRLRTTVVAGSEPGTVVLVGGGDPTLSALPAGVETIYGQPARLDDLVAQVRASGKPVQRVQVDTSRYRGEPLAPGWFPDDVPSGYVAPIEPVMLDGGRADPTEPVSARSASPARAAAEKLASRLGVDGEVGPGNAPPGSRVLGTVESPPIEQLVATTLRTSDNVLAEALARQVAITAGAPPTFEGSARAVLAALRRAGFDTSGAVLVDGSGLSVQDRVTPDLLAEILAVAAAPDGADPRTHRLRPLLDGLPVAGGNGTLSDRYLAGTAQLGRGFVRAKTGTLDGVNSLAGTVTDTDGRILAFALVSNGAEPGLAQERLDEMAAALRTCGCR